MMKILPSQWMDFQKMVAVMPNDSEPIEVLKSILRWLMDNSEIILSEPFLSYKLGRFLDLQLDCYPVDMSSIRGAEFDHFKKVIKKYNSQDAESIARYLRDTLESLVVLEVDKDCPKCEHWGVGAYKSCHDERIVFECRQCGYVFDADSANESTDEFTFASIEDLRRAGLL